MSLTATLIALLSGLEPDDAQRALTTAAAQDDPTAPAPREFARGRGARAYGLAVVIVRNPIRFWFGVAGLIVFPAYLFFRVGAWFYG
jgi:hypothetical protein